jgi:polar amino acid transport system substrate-binding protein
MRTRKGILAGAIAGLCAAAVVAGCGSSSSSSSSTGATSTSGASSSAAAGVTADPAVAKLVPSSVKSKGLIVASDASYAPDEFFASDGKTVIGMDPDLVKALGAVMGVKVTVQNAVFDSIIPGLQANKYNMGASSFTDTKEREKTVDFVTYFTAGESFITKASGGVTVSSLSDICGKSVAVEKGTTEETDATNQSAKCKKEGKGAVNVLVFPDQNGANLALSSGRAQLGFADSPVAAYAVKKSGGQFKLTGPTFASAPYGLAVPKNSGLTQPTLAALKVLMKDGKYHAILATWGLQAGAINNPKINGATS